MISESQQEDAALYALGLLDAAAADAFEGQLDAEPELRALDHDLREAVASLALVGDGSVAAAPAALRARVMASIPVRQGGESGVPAKNVVAFQRAWLPWALAAVCMGCAGGILWEFGRVSRQATELRSALDQQQALSQAQAETLRASSDPLAKISFCALAPTPAFNTAQPHAAVLWDAASRRGQLRVNDLTPPAAGKDYQLWTVETGRQAPVSAGVFHVRADGTADVPFHPVDADGKPVVAVAISLEAAGGSETNRGPILLLGKL